MTGLFKDLDWPTFLDYAAEQARTPYGKARLNLLATPDAFAPTLERAQELQNETQEISAIIDKEALWGPLRDLQEIHDEMESLRKGGVLEVGALARVRGWLYCFDAWANFPRETAGKHFKQALQGLFDPMPILRVFDRVLTPTGELSEKASPKLATLYSQIRDLKREIVARMDTLMREYGARGVLQEKFTDVRDGRYVLPVKVSDQSKVDGRVAELSVSKQTVFIEPKEVEQLQAQLRRREAEASEEIFVILQQVSMQIQPYADSIEGSAETVSYWDAVQARARLAKKYGGRMITLSANRDWILQETVNPLLFWILEESQIVRNSIEIYAPQQMVLLSGPNTGGKTVLLKTLGLSALAARTGFFYPGTGKLYIPFFDDYFVDLGDPQSIEEHISSFSGHVLKMKRILDRIGEKSLILVDEMNSATDPEEGAALALAFVEAILERAGAILVATTHDPRLKAMGVQDKRVLSASILFDEQTLKPTYRVVFGAPGRSRALETAERLGMPKSVLDRAKSFLSQEHRAFEGVLNALQAQLGVAEAARREANSLRDEAERLKAEWEEKVKVTVQDSIEKARAKLKHVLELAQIEVRDTVRKIQQTRTHKQLDDVRSELSDAFSASEKRIEQAVGEAAPEFAEFVSSEDVKPQAAVFEKGMWVRVPKWKNVGEIIEWDGKRGKVALGVQQTHGMGKAFVVSVYPIEMEPLSERELKTVLGAKATATTGVAAKSKVSVQTENVGHVPEQIDLRGQRLDDAIRAVTTYLDHAYRAGRVEVTIIHGLGTGALREGVRDILKKTNYVVETRDAGSAGATMVRFST
ncbi:MAG: Smr/MutS family protein [Bdellovibrionales bacterium]|nr:Smr/MutS family protein [Bdellovibrionales bacterium]